MTTIDTDVEQFVPPDYVPDGHVRVGDRLEKAGDLWGTPPALLAFARRYFGIERFDFDACAQVQTAVAPEWHGYQADGTFRDALTHPWNPTLPGGVVWVNPPYSRGNLLAFAQSALRQFTMGDPKYGSTGPYPYAPNVDRIIFLGKLDPSTRWFKLLAKSPRCHEVVMLSPRVHFLHHETRKPVRGTNFCSVLFDLRRSTPKRKTYSLAEFARDESSDE